MKPALRSLVTTPTWTFVKKQIAMSSLISGRQRKMGKIGCVKYEVSYIHVLNCGYCGNKSQVAKTIPTVNFHIKQLATLGALV